MKEVRRVTACEHCGEDIDLAAPPPEYHYREGRIDIRAGSVVLLDTDHKRSGYTADISGYYCDVECFIDHIRALRTPPAAMIV